LPFYSKTMSLKVCLCYITRILMCVPLRVACVSLLLQSYLRWIQVQFLAAFNPNLTIKYQIFVLDTDTFEFHSYTLSGPAPSTDQIDFSIVTAGSSIFVLGGWDDNQETMLNDLYVLDTSTNFILLQFCRNNKNWCNNTFRGMRLVPTTYLWLCSTLKRK